MSHWGTWRSWWTRGTWRVIGESTGRSWRAWRSRGKIRGSTRWSWGWAIWQATWWAVRWASWRSRGSWLIVAIFQDYRWLSQQGQVERLRWYPSAVIVSVRVIVRWYRLIVLNLRAFMEGQATRWCFSQWEIWVIPGVTKRRWCMSGWGQHGRLVG